MIESSEYFFDRVTRFRQSDKTHKRTQETAYVLQIVEKSSSKFRGNWAWNNQWYDKTDNIRNPDNHVHDRDGC